MICGSGGSKSRLAKAAGAEPAGQMRDEKLHAVVTRSTFRSQNVQNTPFSDHFWKLRCRKSARCCGAKHISKSKCTKHYMFAPLLEVQMSKKYEKVHAVVARSTFRSENVQNTRVRTTFGGSDVASPLRFYTTLRYITPHSTILHYITLHYTPQHYNYNYTTRLHSTTLNFTTLHYTTLRSTTLHYIKSHYTPLHFTTLHSTTLHSTTLQLQLHNYTPLH